MQNRCAPRCSTSIRTWRSRSPRRLQLAARQTPAFVQTNWKNAAIRTGLLGLFNGIPISEPWMYSQIAAASDPNFPNEYLVLNCVYKAQIQAPQLPGYVQWQVNWRDRAYNYYQDNQDRARVFYLPDAFAFDKGPKKDAPSVSLLQFKLPPGGTGVEQTTRHLSRLRPARRGSRADQQRGAVAEGQARRPAADGLASGCAQGQDQLHAIPAERGRHRQRSGGAARSLHRSRRADAQRAGLELRAVHRALGGDLQRRRRRIRCFAAGWMSNCPTAGTATGSISTPGCRWNGRRLSSTTSWTPPRRAPTRRHSPCGRPKACSPDTSDVAEITLTFAGGKTITLDGDRIARRRNPPSRSNDRSGTSCSAISAPTNTATG